MAERVFWHIGLPKTATTYLQGILWRNRKTLAAQRLLLPGSGHRHHLLATLELRGDPSLSKRPRAPRHPWRELVDEVTAWSGDALITHEFFCSATPEQVRSAIESFQGARVEVIVTARSMVDIGISRWQEWVRNGGMRSIDHYPPRDGYDPRDSWGWGSFDLADVLERWGSVLPHDQIHVLPMRAGADPLDIWQRFASVLGIAPDSVDAGGSASNRSMGVVETELLRRTNRALTGFRSAHDRGRWIRGHLAKPAILPPSGERFRPGARKLAELTERGERARSMLSTGAFDVVGDLDALQPRDVSGYRHPSEVTDAEMLDAATTVIANLLEEVRSAAKGGGPASRGQNRAGMRVTVSRFLRAARR